MPVPGDTVPQRIAAAVRTRAVDPGGLMAAWMPLDGWACCLLGANPGSWRVRRPVHFGDDTTAGRVLKADEVAAVNRFSSLKRQIEWAAGRWLVRHLVTTVVGIDDRAVVAVDHRGAPRLAGRPDLRISISHSGAWAAAALSRSADMAIGIDVETQRGRDFYAILKAGFSKRESTGHGGPDAASHLCRAWTVKEAYLKLIGRGFQEPLQQVEVLDGKVHHKGHAVAGLALDSWQPDTDHWITVAMAPQAA